MRLETRTRGDVRVLELEGSFVFGSGDAKLREALDQLLEEGAIRMLGTMRRHVRPGGRLILNVLIEGTTFLDMFEGDYYHLFAQGELEELLSDWEPLLSQRDSIEVTGGSAKEFLTLVYRRPVE